MRSGEDKVADRLKRPPYDFIVGLIYESDSNSSYIFRKTNETKTWQVHSDFNNIITNNHWTVVEFNIELGRRKCHTLE